MAIVTYSESIGYTFTNFIVLAVSAVFHVFFVYLFIGVLDLGWEGILIATGLHFVVRFLTAFIYLICAVKPYKETQLDFLNKETFTNLKPQVQRGFGSLLMGCWSWWAFDIFTLICLYLEPESIASA